MIPSLSKFQSFQGEAVAAIHNVLKLKVQVRVLRRRVPAQDGFGKH